MASESASESEPLVSEKQDASQSESLLTEKDQETGPEIVDVVDKPVNETVALALSTLNSNVFCIAGGFATLLFGAYQFGSIGFSAYPLLCLFVGFGVSLWTLRENYQRSKEIQNAIRTAVALDEKGCILAGMEHLPSWVFFPETERAEWLNKILRQLWPFVGHYVHDLLKETVEPAIRENLPSYLKSFKFEKVILGDMPPRIGGIKVYQENVARNEIIMDVDIRYVGDSHIQVIIKGLKAGIKGLEIHGMLRVILKPLVKKIPLIGGVTVFFLNRPRIDFNLTNVANVLDIPGLGDILRRTVSEQLASMMVLPNRYSITLMEGVPIKDLKFQIPAGVLRINLVEGKDLVRGDVGMLGMGKSDPYALISVGVLEFKTPVLKNTIFPKWNYFCEAPIDQYVGQVIDIEVMDEDQGSKDDFLGKTSVDISPLVSKGKSSLWLRLENVKTGRINLRTTWLALSDDPNDLQQQLLEIKRIKNRNLSSAILLVFLDSAKHLPCAPRSSAEPSPQANLIVSGQQEASSICPNTNDPVWEESFRFLLTNPDVQDLTVEVVDTKSGKPLGMVKIHLRRLLKEADMQVEEPFHLHGGGPNSKIFLTIQLRILKEVECNGEDITPMEEEEGKDLSEESSIHTKKKDISDTSSDTSMDASPIKRSQNSTIPSLQEMVHSTVQPILDTIDINHESGDNFPRTPESSSPVKQSSPPPSTPGTKEENFDDGAKIQLTLRYSIPRNKLIVVVHKVINIPCKEGEDIPDPYVKIYLLPDRAKEGKQKTQICKNTCNPVFDESLEFEANMSDVSNYSLDISVNSRSGSIMFPRGRTVCKTTVDLSQLDMSKAVTEWYDLTIVE